MNRRAERCISPCSSHRFVNLATASAAEEALMKARKQKGNGKLLLQPNMVAAVLDPDVAPSSQQRYGLEQLLLKQRQWREERYQAFRQHWYQLQARDFRPELLDTLTN